MTASKYSPGGSGSRILHASQRTKYSANQLADWLRGSTWPFPFIQTKKTTLAMQGWSMPQLQYRQAGMCPELSADVEATRAVLAVEACRHLNFYRCQATSLWAGDADFILIQMS